MTTVSWPVREQPITHELWREEFAGADGITDDLAGDAFRLTLPSSGDSATILGSGKYRLRGYILQVTADHTVTIPAVVSGAARTYAVGIKYDPALEAAASGPLTIFSLQKGTFAPSGGTAYSTLWEVTRSAGQVLSAASLLDARSWAASSHYGGSGAHAGIYPVGARLVLSSGLELLRVPDVVSGVVVGTRWRSLSSPVWSPLPLSSFLTTYQDTPSYARLGSEVIVRGSVQRSLSQPIASAGTTAVIGTLPSGYRPAILQRFPAAVSFAGSSVSGRLTVGTSGEIQFSPSHDGATWTTLDSIRFFISPQTGPVFGA